MKLLLQGHFIFSIMYIFLNFGWNHFYCFPCQFRMYSWNILSKFWVTKCHGYGGYIRLKTFASWGEKSGRRCNLAKFSLFWALLLPGEMNIFQIQCRIEFNTFLLRKPHSRCIKWLGTMLMAHVVWLVGIPGHYFWLLVLTGNIWWLGQFLMFYL